MPDTSRSTAAVRLTSKQHDCLLALNYVAMRLADSPGAAETGVYSAEVAGAAHLSTRSAAVVLSQMRDFRWVESRHGSRIAGTPSSQRSWANFIADLKRKGYRP